MSREFRDALFIFTTLIKNGISKSKWLKSNLKPPLPTSLIFTVVNSLIRVIVQIMYLSDRVYFSIIIKVLRWASTIKVGKQVIMWNFILNEASVGQETITHKKYLPPPPINMVHEKCKYFNKNLFINLNCLFLHELNFVPFYVWDVVNI